MYANVMMPGDGALGVVYRCTAAELAKLDVFENGYDRAPRTVIVENGDELTAEVYFAKPERVTAERAPSAEYWQRILTGAREQALPEEYIAQIAPAAIVGR